MEAILVKLNKWTTSFAILATASIVVSSCALGNHPPVITNLEAEQDVVPSSGSCRIVCVASDKDGDELTYEWSTSNGNIDGDGPIVVWIAPESVGIYDITVEVTDGNGGKAKDSVTIITVAVNSPPAIVSLIADADWVSPSSSSRIECNAEDPDGDSLRYEWSTSGGDISSTGPVVTWTAPEAAGIYEIAVAVSDGQGKEDTRSLTIRVVLTNPLVIETLIVTPEEPKYSKGWQEGYKILKGRSCEIECVVSDGDELSYEWSATGGDISDTGSVATWTAPSSAGEFAVTVTVSDKSGGVVTEAILFRVETCACVFR